jgi:asparagine synthase (glutamine-hydrolysing)
VTALAALEMAAQGRNLYVFTHVPAAQGLGALVDEGPLAADLMSSMRAARHCLVTDSDWAPIRALRRWRELFGVPSYANSNVSSFLALLDAAQRRAVTTLFYGQAGDLVMNWGIEGLSAATWLRAGRYREAVRRVVPRRLRAWRLRTLGRRPQSEDGGVWGTKPIHPDFADALDLRTQLRYAGRDPVTLLGARNSSAQRLFTASATLGPIASRLGAAFGVILTDPFMTRPVIEFAARLPSRLWVGPQDRWLLRQAMADVLPDRTRLRRWKGIQGVEFPGRLASDRKAMEEALDEIAQSALAAHYVDVQWCRTMATTVPALTSTSLALDTSNWLIAGLEMGLFLASVERGEW